MRRTSKASSVGSTKRQATGLGSFLRGGNGGLPRLLALAFCFCALGCLLAGSALAAETRPQIGSFGPDGTSATSFGFPGAIGVDQGTHDIYVADYSAGKVEKFDENHAPSNFSALGSNEIGGFSFFSGEALQEIAVNSTSHALYVADYGNSAIKAFKQNGEALDFTAGPGAGTNALPEISEVCGVAVDANGLIYMGDYGTGVHIFNPSGEELTSFPVSGPCNLAVDSAGAVYVSHYPFFGEGKVDKFTPSEFPVTASTTYPASGKAIDPNPTFGVAVDPSNDDLYVDYGKHVSVFNSSGALRYEFASGISSSEGLAVDAGTGRAYAADAASGKVGIFGAPVPLPSVTAEDADAVAATTATLHATVNPEGKQLTGCHFEFVPASQFNTDEYASVTSAQEAPCVPAAASIPPDSTNHAVKADVSGLEPGTTYHFRLLAETAEGTANGGDHTFITAISAPVISEQTIEAVGSTDATLSAKINPKGAPATYHLEYGTSAAYGQSSAESAPIGFQGDDSDHPISVHIGGLSPGTAYHFRFVATSLAGKAEGGDDSFATYPTAPSFGSCPNDEFRSGFGARLPDCRAYEQATPTDKHGTNVEGSADGVQASSAGDRVTFFASGGLPTTGGSSQLTPFMASRGPSGWSSDGLLPLIESGAYAEVPGWTDDLATTLVEVRRATGVASLYQRDSDTAAFQLALAIPGNFGPGGGSVDGYAADASHLLFEARAALLPGAAGLLPGAPAAQKNLYDLDHGTLTLPGRIPVAPATSCDDDSGPACVPAPEGALAGGREDSATAAVGEGGGYNANNAISRDGSKVYFTDQASRQLYLREDGTRTTQVSASQKTNGTGPGGSDPLGPLPTVFREATADGAHAFFTSREQLTDDATTGTNPGIGTALINGIGAERGLIPLPAAAAGVAVDGSYVYWANPDTNTIGRAELNGSGVEQSFITGASNPQGVAVDGSHVYWTNAAGGADGAGTIGRANLDGSGANQGFITGASNPQGVAVDGSHVYWTNAGSTEATRAIGRAELDGTAPEQSFVAVTGPSGPWGVAVNASFVYWTNPGSGASGAGAIGRATITGNNPRQELVTGLSAPRGIALDGTSLFWANHHNIGRARLDGIGAPDERALFFAAGAQGLAEGNQFLYWSGYDPGKDLYRYDSASGELTDVSVDSSIGDRKGADVQGFLGASPDGSYAYFVASGVLAPGGVSGSQTTNLYLSHAGTTTFVAQLEGGDGAGDPENWINAYYKTSRITADGTLVFASRRLDLSGHDHGSCACTQFYRYTPSNEALNCITCTTTGTPARSGAELASNTAQFLGSSPHHTFLHRNLSADGKRFFFETAEALLPSDTNRVKDVYEWEAKGSGSCESESQNGGCIYLISSGTSPVPSHFADASADGDHVFFFTDQQLVPGDRDELTDVYDAGVGAGLASQHTLAPPTCAGAACQANAAPPPDLPAASAVFTGPGNAHKPAAARKCPKGKRKVRRAGKVRCQKAHKAKQHKLHSNRGGSK